MDWQSLRLEGIVRQPDEGFAFRRIKLPAGVLSAQQARGIAATANDLGRKCVHLTTRGNIEIHWIREQDVEKTNSRLAALGLDARGACGGAVRGIAYSGAGIGHEFAAVAGLARLIHNHFSGHPRYEKLPKKFKVGFSTDPNGGVHIVQDVGLLLCKNTLPELAFDVWIAGGLGRAPQAGFLLEQNVPHTSLIPLIEAVLNVYIALAPIGKRLKHVAAEIGAEALRKTVFEEYSKTLKSAAPQVAKPGFARNNAKRLEAKIFAGELASADLNKLADFAEAWTGGELFVTTDQNLAFNVAGDFEAAKKELARLGFDLATPEQQVGMTVCPGSHECRHGLAPTRDIAKQVLAAMGPKARSAKWAVSGCQNSCAHPQLANYGILVSCTALEAGQCRVPRFDFYEKNGQAFGKPVKNGLTLKQLLETIAAMG